MKNFKKLFIFIYSCCFFIFFSCNDEESYIALDSPVSVDLTQVPYQKLSDYKFFEGDLKNLNPAYGVIPYKPTSELFTDYAKKKRFIWLPKGAKANYVSDGEILNLPIGSALIKNFYYNNVQPNNTTRIIETRLMIRKSSGWIFANYVWNDQQSEAFLQSNGSQTLISWLDEDNSIQTISYKIPSTVLDCKKCHGNIDNSIVQPIGIKPQNLNSHFTYSDGSKNQLEKLIEFGYLEDNLPQNIVSIVNYKDTSKSLNLRVRSYFDSNCAHCHNSGGDADHFALRLAFNQTNVSSNMGVCVSAEHLVSGYGNRIIHIGNYNQSILHYRINTTTDINFMMPPIGRTVKQKESVQLIEEWINSLNSCE